MIVADLPSVHETHGQIKLMACLYKGSCMHTIIGGSAADRAVEQDRLPLAWTGRSSLLKR